MKDKKEMVYIFHGHIHKIPIENRIIERIKKNKRYWKKLLQNKKRKQ